MSYKYRVTAQSEAEDVDDGVAEDREELIVEEFDTDEDIPPPRQSKYRFLRCSKKTIIISLGLAVPLLIIAALIVGVTVSVLVKGQISPPTPPVSNTGNCSIDSIVCPSTRDNRKYRVMTLNNSLRVLLISDPSTYYYAASMDVAAGSFNDPPDYEGLAHFCEHMLFIATEKYPKTNQYSSFLQQCYGSFNAYTTNQHTNYYFGVGTEFPTALDMFAHFFIDPLFSKESVMDEMNAIDAEHQKNLHSDLWKLWQLLKNVSNPLHPFSQFSTGSLETLNKSDIRDQLLHYFNSRYSANAVS